MGTIGTQTVNTTDRLTALRKLMAEHSIDTYIVPSEDQRERSGLHTYPIEDQNRCIYLCRFQRVPCRV